MKIAVCIKRVPDSETRVKIAPDAKSIEEAGVKFLPNTYEEFRVEEALGRKENAMPRGGGRGSCRKAIFLEGDATRLGCALRVVKHPFGAGKQTRAPHPGNRRSVVASYHAVRNRCSD